MLIQNCTFLCPCKPLCALHEFFSSETTNGRNRIRTADDLNGLSALTLENDIKIKFSSSNLCRPEPSVRGRLRGIQSGIDCGEKRRTDPSGTAQSVRCLLPESAVRRLTGLKSSLLTFEHTKHNLGKPIEQSLQLAFVQTATQWHFHGELLSKQSVSRNEIQ